MRVNLAIQVGPRVEVSVDEERLTCLAEEALRLEGVAQLCELGLYITDDEEIRELNRQYREVDEATDVLAFGEKAEGFVMPEGYETLGEVVISYTRAAAQAREASHPLEEEVELLFVHGVLHLLGYDDQAPEERARMWARQEEILGK